MPKKPPIPKSRPRLKKKKSTMREQQPPLVKNHYAGLGLATGIAGYAVTSAIRESMSSKGAGGRRRQKVRNRVPLKDLPSYEQRFAERRAKSANRIKKIKAEQASYDLQRMQKINPNHLNDSDKKIRNQIIEQSKKTIKDAIPHSKFAKTLTNVARVSPGTAVVLTILDYLQGRPAGEGSAITGPGSKKK